MNKPIPNAAAAVLGGGISGLSTAYALQKKGISCIIYEKNDQPGGVMQTYRKNGWLVEGGPNTMLVRNKRIWDLLDELQLSHRIQTPGVEAKKRYIVRDGNPLKVPTSITNFLKTDLLSVSAKLRLLKEPFISAPEKQDESIAAFIRRRLGTEPLDYGVNPFVSGVYAGDPKQLSIKHTFHSLYEKEQKYGSIAKGFIKQKKDADSTRRTLISFDEGLQVLPRAIANNLGEAVRLNTKVQRITKNKNGWDVQLYANGEKINRRHKVIISTVPAYRLSKIWQDEHTTRAMHALNDIEYAPMSVLGLGFRRDQIRHPLDGFGVLIPEKEPFSMLGCLFSSSLFPNRAPENHVLLTCFIGGARRPELAAQPTDELIKKIMPQLHTLLGVQGDPVLGRHQFWPQAIPQYTVGYDGCLQAMEQIESAKPGLFLAGNYRGGVAAPDCILNGFETAEGLTTH